MGGAPTPRKVTAGHLAFMRALVQGAARRYRSLRIEGEPKTCATCQRQREPRRGAAFLPAAEFSALIAKEDADLARLMQSISLKR